VVPICETERAPDVVDRGLKSAFQRVALLFFTFESLSL
jgi:hypothetical protein